MAVQARGKSGYVEANGIRQHYLEYGRGPVEIVIVPGITSPAITWEFVSEELARDYRVITLDVRGRGLSDKPHSDYSLPEYAADVAGLIGALGLRRPVVLGHSMGARIAIALGALHPDVPGPLIIVDPPLTGPGRESYATPLASFRTQLAEAYAGTTADAVRRFFPGWSEEALQIRAEWLPTCAEHAVVATYNHFDSEEIFGYWAALRPPILFIRGGDSPVISPVGEQELRERNLAAEIVVTPGAGHMIPWDNLADFLAQVRAFVVQATA